MTAAGSLPLSYQWRFNATNIAGATATNYTRTNAQSADAGNYSVVVTNLAGSATSSNAVLTVNVPPSNPRFSSINRSGTNLIFSGTGGPTNGDYYVLTSTNVALPLINWTRVLTNQFDANGNFIFTNAISPGEPRRFYVLQVHLDAALTVFFSYGTGGTGSAGTVSGTPGSTWHVKHDLTSATISSFPDTWKEEGFDDSTWITRPGQTGYGDMDENHAFVRVDYDSGTGGTQSGPSYLFRSTFSIADVNAVASVTGEVKYDDGAVVYVNGTQILRTTNLDPAGTLTSYADFNGAAATENATNSLNVPLNLLHNGVNTIAVEIHQESSTSLDVTFDLKLQAN